MNRLSRYFVNGLLILVPIIITYVVIATVLGVLDGFVEHYVHFQFPGSGVILLLVIILFAGWVKSTWKWASNSAISLFERLIDKIPVVKFIYSSVKRVSTMLLESKTMFSQVVLIPYPHQGVRSIGFLMPKPSKLLAPYLSKEEEYESVFLPWSLNMTSGFNVFVPKKDIVYVDISVEDAFQYILTAGGVMPGANIKEDLQKIHETNARREALQKHRELLKQKREAKRREKEEFEHAVITEGLTPEEIREQNLDKGSVLGKRARRKGRPPVKTRKSRSME